MSEHFTIQRAAEGLSWPFGAGAVAAGSAVLGGISALVTPMATLDWLAYQGYLDQIAGLTPPLGLVAKLAFVALLAALFGGLGYAVARWAGVRSTGGLAELVARLRGARDEDEDGAPRLRGSDRHPDAPARRPLSATRDLSVEAMRTADEATSAQTLDGADDDDDELLLVSPLVSASHASDSDRVEPTATSPQMPVLPSQDDAPASVDMHDADWSDADEEFDIPAPHADDWLISPAPAPVASATLGEMRQADVRLPIDATVIAPVAVDDMAEPAEVEPSASFNDVFAPVTPPPPPLDLSAARLDELIARVEAGMKRRDAVPVATSVAEVAMPSPLTSAAMTPSYSPTPVITMPVAEEADPSFPNDPALAAALATLRRMAAA